MAFEQVILRTSTGQDYGPVSMETLQQWHQQGRVPRDATLVDSVSGETQPVTAFPILAVAPPPMPAAPGQVPAAAPAPGGMQHVIPTSNPAALVAYYCAIFGLIPCVTTPLLGLAGLILGIIGQRKVKTIGVGKAHALVGIILGSLETLVSIGTIVFLIMKSAIS